jgi:CheY-like chemotaxis protein
MKAQHGSLKDAGGGRTILLVEDHVDTRRALSRTLEQRGFRVTTADSVSAACEQFGRSRPDLMLCDIGLPDGTGWDLMKLLRPRGMVPAIAMSGYSMDRDVQRSRDAGFLTHLVKPIDLPKLEQMIAESLNPSGEPKGGKGIQPK